VVGLSKGNRGSFDGRDMKERKGYSLHTHTHTHTIILRFFVFLSLSHCFFFFGGKGGSHCVLCSHGVFFLFLL